MKLLKGEGRGDGERRAALRALPTPPSSPPIRICTMACTSGTIELRLDASTAATTMPIHEPRRYAPTKLGRDPLKAFIAERNKPRRR